MYFICVLYLDSCIILFIMNTGSFYFTQYNTESFILWNFVAPTQTHYSVSFRLWTLEGSAILNEGPFLKLRSTSVRQVNTSRLSFNERVGAAHLAVQCAYRTTIHDLWGHTCYSCKPRVTPHTGPTCVLISVYSKV